MRSAIILAVVIALTGCYKDAESTQRVNRQFEVETLFTKDGCTVYRFHDGSYRYFTNCHGDTTWREGCGKSCSRDVTVDGGKQ